jgi:hypothetical protein
MQFDLINRPTQTLIATAIVLALVVALQLGYPAGPGDRLDPQLDNAGEALPDFGDTRFDPPPMTLLSDMLDRPLFFANRRMPEPPRPVAAPAPPPTPLRLKLEGIAITGETRVAVLRSTATNELLQLAEGMTHDGWTLDSVNANSAKFTRGAEVNELPLDPGATSRRR